MLMTPPPTFQSEFCATILPPQRGRNGLQTLSLAILLGLFLICAVVLASSGNTQRLANADFLPLLHETSQIGNPAYLQDGLLDISLRDIFNLLLSAP